MSVKQSAQTVTHRAMVFLTGYFWPVLPLSLGGAWIHDGIKEHHIPLIAAGAVWVLIAGIGVLVCHAVYRIRVNITQYRRPFTQRDHKFCHWARNAALLGWLTPIAASFIPAFYKDSYNGISYLDAYMAQGMLLLLASALLGIMAEMHNKGMQLMTELEKGV